MRLQRREVLRDWTRVENFEVDASKYRTYEYHVVQDCDARRVTITIRVLDPEANRVRLDPTVIPDGTDPAAYADIAERRVRRLYHQGKI